MNFIVALFILSFCSSLSHAAIPANQRETLRDYVQSKLIVSSPSSTELLNLLGKSVDETARPMEAIKNKLKALNLVMNKAALSLQNKVQAEYDPFKVPGFTNWVNQVSVEQCCANLNARRPKLEGE